MSFVRLCDHDAIDTCTFWFETLQGDPIPLNDSRIRDLSLEVDGTNISLSKADVNYKPGNIKATYSNTTTTHRMREVPVKVMHRIYEPLRLRVETFMAVPRWNSRLLKEKLGISHTVQGVPVRLTIESQ